MNFNEIKQAMIQSPDLSGLDSQSQADLLWRAEVECYSHSEVIYQESETLDNTFCLLLQGDLIVEKGSAILAGIFEGQVFGEMAFFIKEGRRTATIRVGSDSATILRFRIDSSELNNDRMIALKRCLSRCTWDRFVSVTQHAGESSEVAASC